MLPASQSSLKNKSTQTYPRDLGQRYSERLNAENTSAIAVARTEENR
jgi:hypothetical protein